MKEMVLSSLEESCPFAVMHTSTDVLAFTFEKKEEGKLSTLSAISGSLCARTATDKLHKKIRAGKGLGRISQKVSEESD